MVLPLIGSLLAPTLFAGAGGLSAATLAGLGAGVGSLAQGDDLGEALSTGLISGLTAGVAGKFLGAGSGAGEAAATATGVPAGAPTVPMGGGVPDVSSAATQASSEAAKSLFNPTFTKETLVAGATGGLGAMANQPMEQEPIKERRKFADPGLATPPPPPTGVGRGININTPGVRSGMERDFGLPQRRLVMSRYQRS